MLQNIEHIDLHSYELSDEVMDGRVEAALAKQPDAVLFDVVRDEHLSVVGRLMSGGFVESGRRGIHRRSVIARNEPTAGRRREQRCASIASSSWQIRSGQLRTHRGGCRPVFAMPGSLSPLTAIQIESATLYQRVPIDAPRLANGDATYFADIANGLATALRAGDNGLGYTSRPDTTVNPDLARHTGRLVRAVLESTRVERVGIAGADTSSHVLRTLGPTRLDWSGRPAPGVALSRGRSGQPWFDDMEIMLKGGQMGRADLFDALVAGR